MNWTKDENGVYRTEVNGRRFGIRHNRKTHSRRIKNEFGFGSHRRSSTITWYSVFETIGADEETQSVNLIGAGDVPPGTLEEAKTIVQKAACK